MADLTQYSDEELQSRFRQHSLRGMMVSLALLVSFLVLYFYADSTNTVVTTVFAVISVASIGMAIWYHLEKRKYFKEFKRRRRA